MKKCTWVEETDYETMKEQVKELIRIPSVTTKEGKLAQYVAKVLESMGMDKVQLQPVLENRYNVIAEMEGALPGKRILLTGHLDTVPPGDGWSLDPYDPEEKGDRIYGRGSNDMKGGIAVILQTVRILLRNRQALRGGLTVALLADEEACSEGACKLCQEGLFADFGLSAEPEYGAMMVGAAGKVLIRVLVKGKAAHAAKPQEGVNAIADAGRFLEALERVTLPSHTKIAPQPYVPLKIEGGFREYSLVVPDRCVLLLNKHTVPGESAEQVLDQLQTLAQSLRLSSQFTFTVEKPCYPPYLVDETHPHVIRLREIYESVTGRNLSLFYGDGVCDNNYIVPQLQIPIVCLGPGGEGIHSADEWVSFQQMKDMLQIYVEFLLS